MSITKWLRLDIPTLMLVVVLASCTGVVPPTTPTGIPGVASEAISETKTITATAAMTGAVHPAEDGVSAIHDSVGNLTYTGIYTEAVALQDGVYTGEPLVSGGASRPTVTLTQVAAGDLNGDGEEDAAVVLAEDSGGSGTFIYLAAVVTEAGTMTNTATILLGDRWQIDSLTIIKGEISLDVLRPGANDPQCCPSEHVIQHYILQDGQLELAGETTTVTTKS